MRLLPPKRPRLRRPTLRPDPGHAEPDTVRAFLIAPLVPAGMVGLAATGAGPALGALALVCAALSGYAAAILIGMPLYLAVPERVRRSTAGSAAAGGTVAALVPVTAIASTGGGTGALAWAAGIFLLGSLGGLIFALIRNAPLE